MCESSRVEGGSVTYFHLLFAQHEIIVANGAKTESYYPGHAISKSERRTQAEILALFPELDQRGIAKLKTARPVVHPREGRLIAI